MSKRNDCIAGFLVGAFLCACLFVAAIYFLREDAKQYYGGMDIPHSGPDHRPAIERVKE